MHTRHNRLFALLTLTLVACADIDPNAASFDETTDADAAPYDAEEIGETDQSLVGFTNYDSPEIGMVTNGENVNAINNQFCTGTAIAPNVILTAAHCLGLSRYFYTVENPFAWKRYTVAAVWSHPLYNGAAHDSRYDIALLKIHPTQRVPFTRPMKENGPVGVAAAITGFGGNNCPGRQDIGPNSGIGIKRVGFFNTQANGNISTAIVCGGDSGGPIVDMADGKIFGVTSDSSGTGPGGTGSFCPTNGPGNTWSSLNFVTFIWQSEANQGR